VVEKVQAAVDKVKEALKTDDMEKIKAETDALMKVAHELAAAAYEQAGPQPGAAASGAEQASPKDDNVVDAEYKVVDDEKK
ncbi:MAG TPA: molecular chaperone DnaK, partial [Firmicutes bacterium]|nr:molecular chaperone DnaK [Bacillota bacterium]